VAGSDRHRRSGFVVASRRSFLRRGEVE